MRAANDPLESNIRLDPLTIPKVIKDKHDIKNEDDSTTADYTVLEDNANTDRPSMPIIDPADLVGRTFLTLENEDGQRLRVRIVKAIDDYDDDCAKDSNQKKFVCTMKDDTIEEIFSYNEILDHLNQQDEDTVVWKFKRIKSHEGPLRQSHPNYNCESS